MLLPLPVISNGVGDPGRQYLEIAVGVSLIPLKGCMGPCEDIVVRAVQMCRLVAHHLPKGTGVNKASRRISNRQSLTVKSGIDMNVSGNASATQQSFWHARLAVMNSQRRESLTSESGRI